MKTQSIFEKPAIIGYLVKKILEEHPDKQVGKTLIQKMAYLLSRSDVVDFGFSLYHYGPYSAEVASDLNFAECCGIVEIKWIDEEGYFIKPGLDLPRFEPHITSGIKESIDKLVKSDGRFNAIELSIIATAYFVSDNFGVSMDRIVDVVHDVKPNHQIEFIKKKLQEANVITT